MLNFPNAKLNLGLRILNKRSDGFHNIESVFYPVNYCDALEIIPSDSFSFQSNNNKFSQQVWENLCVKAYELLRVDFELPPVSFFLHKNIPIGAGLGGGSSDAAFTLKMLDRVFNLKLTDNKLEGYAAQLGSDCVFFINNNPALVTGRGELLQPIELDLSRYSIIIVTPELSVNTASAYKLWDELMGQIRQKNELSLKDIIKLPVEEWKHHLKNDFENVIFNEYPILKIIEDKLYEKGAHYASLSGSGSSLFALFKRDENIKKYLEKKFKALGVNITLFCINNQ